MKYIANRFSLYLAIMLFFLLPGCISMDTGEMSGNAITFGKILNSSPKVSLFFSLKEPEGLQLSMQLSNIELFDGEEWHSITGKPLWVEALAIGEGQTMVGRSNLPPGRYSKIRFSVISAIRHEGENNIILTEIRQPAPQTLSPPLSIDKGDSTSLFMNWDTSTSIEEEGRIFNAQIQTSVQAIPLTTGLAYVTCPAIDTIYIIRTDTNQVTGSWGVSGYPSHVSVFKERNELYVLAENEAAIKIYELSSGRLKDTFKIPMMNKPFYMVTDTDGQNAYVIDKISNFVSRVDMNSGSLLSSVSVDEKLGFMTYLADHQQLAITSLISHKVYILDASSLNIQKSFSVGSSPVGLLHYNNKLYVAESLSGTILSYDLNTSNIARSHVGRMPQQFAEQNNYIYVSNYGSGTVSVLLPDQLSVLKNIRVGGTPTKMATSSTRNWLYVMDNKEGNITVVDLTSHRVAANIELKAQVLDLDIIQ